MTLALIFDLAQIDTMGGLQTYAFIASERAFVSPTATNFTNGFVVGENPLQMWIAMRNGGKSVATIEELVGAITHARLEHLSFARH